MARVVKPNGRILLAKLNGTDDHNWWIHMEDNLNHATGQFDRKNYLPYTRVINVAWPGDPKFSGDYLVANQSSVEPGRRLAKLLKQLKQHDIKINIIMILEGF